MCHQCWEYEGSPQIDCDGVREAAALVQEVYLFAPTGGNLHIVLDDFNLNNDDLAFCQRRIESADYSREEWRQVERKCCEAMMGLDRQGRASAIALAFGYWTRSET